MELKGTKKVEIPYFLNQLDADKSILIVGECVAVDGISKCILEKGCNQVITTDIRSSPADSWLQQNTNWEHKELDFLEFDETDKYDFIISISVFEHFGLYWGDMSMHGDGDKTDIIRWNHDLRAIAKSCKLLKDKESKLIITLPAGPYMNYNDKGDPILRYYNEQRQQLIKQIIVDNNCIISDEKFYFSEDFEKWDEVGPEINTPSYYPYHNSFTPNVIWAFTVQQS
jgi:hypothetical protein